MLVYAVLIFVAALEVLRVAAGRQGTGRERLLLRDVQRLQDELRDTHDKLMFAVGKDWNVPPAQLPSAEAEEEPEEDHVVSHDDLYGDLLLVPEPAAYTL